MTTLSHALLSLCRATPAEFWRWACWGLTSYDCAIEERRGYGGLGPLS